MKRFKRLGGFFCILAGLSLATPASAYVGDGSMLLLYLITTTSASMTGSGGYMLGFMVPRPNAAPQIRTMGQGLVTGGLLTSLGSSVVTYSMGLAPVGTYNQLDSLMVEAAAGQGPQLNALAESLGVSRESLVGALASAREKTPELTSQDDISRYMGRVFYTLAPDIQLSSALQGDFLVQLDAERKLPASARTPTHEALASWVGLPVPLVRGRVDQVLTTFLSSQVKAGEVQSARAILHVHASKAFAALGDGLEVGNEAALKRKVQVLCASAEYIDPELAREAVVRFGL